MSETIHALCAHSRDLFGELLFRAKVATSGRCRPGTHSPLCELRDGEIKAEVRQRFSQPNAKVILYAQWIGAHLRYTPVWRYSRCQSVLRPI